MKFTEGMWKLKAGVSIDWMSNVERLHVTEKEVSLLLNKFQRHRGDTLNSREERLQRLTSIWSDCQQLRLTPKLVRLTKESSA